MDGSTNQGPGEDAHVSRSSYRSEGYAAAPSRVAPRRPPPGKKMGFRDGGALLAIGGFMVAAGAIVPWAKTTEYVPGFGIPPNTVSHSGFQVRAALAILTITIGVAALVVGRLVWKSGFLSLLPWMISLAAASFVTYWISYATANSWINHFLDTNGGEDLALHLSAGVSFWFILLVGGGQGFLIWGAFLSALRSQPGTSTAK